MAQTFTFSRLPHKRSRFFSSLKTLGFLLLNLLCFFAASAQTVTIPGTNVNQDPGNFTVTRKPLGNYFGFERSAMLFTSAEIGTSGSIGSLAFYVESVNTPAAFTPVVIYMKQTAAASFAASTTVAAEKVGATQVFSGSIDGSDLVAGSWYSINLNTAFTYSTASNLEIIIETNGGGNGIEPNPDSKQFRFSNTPVSRFQYWQSDGIVPTFTGTLESVRPNVQLNFGSLPCNAPTNLSASNVTATSATLNFTANNTGAAGSYIVRFGPQNFPNGGGTVVTGPPYNVSNLTPNTTYDFTVRKDCGNGNTSTIVRSSFTTSQTCDAPTGLSASNVTASSATLNFTGSTTGATGNYIVRFGAPNFPNGGGTLVSGPPYNVSGLSPNTTYEFTVQKDCGANGTSAIVRGSFITTQTCNAPTSLSATSITATSATLTFTGSTTGASGSYIVRFGAQGFPDGGGTVVTGPPYNVSNLTPNTTYDFTVQKNCGASGNSSIVRESFTTLPAPTCAAPTAVSATSVTLNAAQINFSGGATGTSYTLEYGPTATFPASGTTTLAMSGSPFSLTGLTHSTAYSFVVRTHCSNGLTSANSPTGSFTTKTPLTCDAPTNLLATSITTSSATLTFTGSTTGASGNYIVRFGPQGFPNGGGTLVSGPPYNVSGLTPNTTYDFTVQKDCGTDGLSTIVRGSFTTASPGCVAGTWTGTISADWHTAGNWCGNQVPTAATNVLIPAGTPFAPVITQNAFVQNLTLQTGATLTQQGGNTTGITLTIGGLFTNNGTFVNTGFGSLAFTGTTPQTIGKNGQTLSLYNLTVGSGGATLAGPVSVRRLLTLNGDLNTNGKAFTLLADATSQAMVVNNSGVVNGTAKMQRYINGSLNAGPGYRHLASPVASTTLNDLNDPGVNLVVNNNYNLSPNPSTVRPFPTIYSYDESRLTNANATTSAFVFGYKSPASLTEVMPRGEGYSVNMPPVTIDFNGTLNNGNISVGPLSRGNTAESGWHLLGNPYPSPINWDNVTVPAGFDKAVYIYRSQSQYGGSYLSYVNGVGNLPDSSKLIAAAQGFFIRVNSGNPTFTFRNSMRATTYENPPLFRQTSTDTRPLVQLSLENSAGEKDNLYTYFEAGATSQFDGGFDAFKLPNAGTMPTIFALTPTDGLSISGLPLPVANTVVPLGGYVAAAGQYTFRAGRILNLTNTPVYLEDHLLNTQINLQTQHTYPFSTNQTDLTGRFSLRFGPATTTGIPETDLAAATLIFPNPNQGKFTVSMPLKEKTAVTAELYNAIGQRVWQQQYKPANLLFREELSLTGLPTGVYSLRLQTTRGIVLKKLVIE